MHGTISLLLSWVPKRNAQPTKGLNVCPGLCSLAVDSHLLNFKAVVLIPVLSFLTDSFSDYTLCM